MAAGGKRGNMRHDATLERLAERGEVLERMAEAVKSERTHGYELGQWFVKLTHDLDFPYAMVEEYTRLHFGVQLPSKSQMSKLKHVVLVWHYECGIPIEELVPVSPNTLYQLQLRSDVGPLNAREWLERAKTLGRDDLLDMANTLLGKPPELYNLAIERHVAERFNDALDKMRKVTGDPKLSRTAMVEFMAQLVSDSSTASLRSLWLQAHGEDPEDM